MVFGQSGNRGIDFDDNAQGTRSPPHGIAEHHLPAVEHHDQADETHARELPRQPFVRQISLELRRRLPGRRR